MAADSPGAIRTLEQLDPAQPPRRFVKPGKKIHESDDMTAFLTSKAYSDIMTFLLQLNRAMVPRKLDDKVQSWPLGSDQVQFSEPVRRLQRLLSQLESIIDEAPPDTGPRRFGNISFRKWHGIVEERSAELLKDIIGDAVGTESDSVSAAEEVTPYFLGSFGSPQRLDYGTGHELSFLAFVACLWKLNRFPKADPGVEERGIVLGVIQPYLELVRKIIKTYTLEPAGSHGVWGLDDHSFVPYIFGSAQYAPAISDTDQTPVEGSISGAPSPADVTKATEVERHRKDNMYFSAIGFIYDVKKGPFWEHSPMLYDISGIQAGWAKINKGMIKMYNAEVLSKFPVVQHFPFGSLLSWDRDPNATPPPPSALNASRPQAPVPAPGQVPGPTRAPWATGPSNTTVPQAAIRQNPSGSSGPTRAPWTPTKAPWAKPG